MFLWFVSKKLDLPINKTKFLNVWLNPNSIDNTCTPLFKYFFQKKYLIKMTLHRDYDLLLIRETKIM